ncbi:hypothetical protein DPSP01_006129 [Paraphaeosphaeria sporulosa]
MRFYGITTALAILSTGVAAVVDGSQPDLGYAELYKLTQQFYDTFQYPNNVKEAEKINSTIWAKNVQGRVSDTRNFEGRELNTEYIFGLFVPSESVSIIGKPGPFEIIQFAANQNIASATTRVNFTFPSFGNITLPIVIGTWMTYNEAKEITQYDVVFKWFGNVLQLLLSTVDKDPVKAQAKGAIALSKSVCASHTQFCTGKNIQYDSEEECIRFMTKDIRFGQSFELGANTLLCRNVHQKMLPFRPDVHCPHIGKSGGGQCADDITYVQKVTEDYFKNSAWISTLEPAPPSPPYRGH